MARLDLLPYIANTAADIYTAETKTVSVNVTSALPLTDDQKSRITASLPKYANNAQLDVTYEVRLAGVHSSCVAMSLPLVLGVLSRWTPASWAVC